MRIRSQHAHATLCSHVQGENPAERKFLFNANQRYDKGYTGGAYRSATTLFNAGSSPVPFHSITVLSGRAYQVLKCHPKQGRKVHRFRRALHPKHEAIQVNADHRP